MNPEEIDDLIERYVLNRLNEEERYAFEHQLNDHPEWIEKLKFHQSLVATFNPAKISFRNKIKEINKITVTDQNPVKKVPFKLWNLAAGFLILLSAGLFLLLNKTKVTTDELYSTYMVSPASLSPDLSPMRGQVESNNLSISDSILAEVDKKYMNGNINEAISILVKNRDIAKSEKVTFQLGLLELIQSHPQVALQYFDQAAGYDGDELAWYKALTFLKIKNKGECITQLNKITEISRWAAKSKELILKLN